MITVTTQPSKSWHFATEANFGVQTTRRNPVPAANVATLVNSGGKLSIITPAAHGLESGDIVTLLNFSGLQYNKTKITVLSSTSLKCEDVTYSSSITHSGGQVVKTNEGVRIVAEFLVGTEVKHTSSSGVVFSGKYLFDFEAVISRIMAAAISTIPTLMPTAEVEVNTSIPTGCVAYGVSFSEYMNNAFGVPEKVIAAGATTTIPAGTYVAVSGYNYPAQTKWLFQPGTFVVRANETHRFDAYVNNGHKIKCRKYFADGTSSLTTIYTATAARAVAVLVKIQPFSTTTRLEIFLTDANSQISDTVECYNESYVRKPSDVISIVTFEGGVMHFYPRVVEESESIDTTYGFSNVYPVQGTKTRRKTLTIPLPGDAVGATAAANLAVAQVVQVNGKNAAILNDNLPYFGNEFQVYELKILTFRK